MTSCDDVRSAAADLALGLVTGPERAEVLADLETCPSCRRDVDTLAAVSDRIVQLAPEAEPPAGFETRVLRRIEAQVPPIEDRPWMLRHRAPWVMAAAAAVLLVAVAVAGIAVARGGDGQATPPIASVPMLTPDGRVAGELYLSEGDPSWVFLTAPSWSQWSDDPGDEDYVLEAVLADGQELELGRPTLDEGSGAWGTATSIDLSRIQEVALVDEAGHVWCTATLE